MISWLKDLGEVLYDDEHVVLTREQYDRLDAYESIMEPTGPSAGRAYRTHSHLGRNDSRSEIIGLVVFVEPDPEPGFVVRHGRIPLFLDP